MPDTTEINARPSDGKVADSSNAVVALVMAAGRARRFGTDKRREKLRHDCTLLAATVQSMAAVFDAVWVVMRADDDPAELGLKMGLDGVPVHRVRSARADQGLGLSIADGFSALEAASETEQYRAAALILGDMPCVSVHTLQVLRARADADRILRPIYEGKAGHPVVFGRRYWPDLSLLRDATGARSILQRYREVCTQVPVNDPGILMDADRPEDLEALRMRYDRIS